MPQANQVHSVLFCCCCYSLFSISKYTTAIMYHEKKKIMANMSNICIGYCAVVKANEMKWFHGFWWRMRLLFLSFSFCLSYITCVRIDSNGNRMISIEVLNWTYYGTNVLISLEQKTHYNREKQNEKNAKKQQQMNPNKWWLWSVLTLSDNLLDNCLWTGGILCNQFRPQLHDFDS